MNKVLLIISMKFHAIGYAIADLRAKRIKRQFLRSAEFLEMDKSEELALKLALMEEKYQVASGILLAVACSERNSAR